MSKSFLLIVEGAKTEKNILQSVFMKYGFNVVCKEQMHIDDDINEYADFEKTRLSDDKDTVVIIQGIRTRISELMQQYQSQTSDFEKLFGEFREKFAGIFFIYDVDHTSNEDLKKMFDKFQDETSGMLLVSSPCIEIMHEPKRTKELYVQHLKKYKAASNVECHKIHQKSVAEYIIDNFETLALEFISKNYIESNLSNVMEHPQFVIEQINKTNDRSAEDGSVLYRYFTTVVYVCIAYINGLVKEFDNIETVKNFFKNHMNITL